jgi:hypothetical protein
VTDEKRRGYLLGVLATMDAAGSGPYRDEERRLMHACALLDDIKDASDIDETIAQAEELLARAEEAMPRWRALLAERFRR